MGKDKRYDFESGSSDAIDGDSDSSDAQTAKDGEERGNSSGTTVEGRSETSTGDKNKSRLDTDEADSTPSSDNSLPHGGEADPLRTEVTNHTLPEEFSMSNLPIKQRRSNVKQYRDINLTIAIQQKTLDDVRDAKRKLEDHFEQEVPKTDVYEIVMIAGANDDFTLLDAAHIVGYGIN